MIVSLTDAKSHLRIDSNNEDAVLTTLLQQAQATAETYCRVDFENSTDPVPNQVKLAIMLMTGYLFENRDTPDHTAYTTMRMAFENLLYPYRDPTKMF